MRSIKVKVGHGGVITLQHPAAKVGRGRYVSTVEVINIPDGVPAAKVLSVINRCAWITLPQTIDFNSLKPGDILR